MGWARWEGHNSSMKCQPTNLKRTEQDVGVVYEKTSDGNCMEWGNWEAGRQSPAPASPRTCQWRGGLHLRPSSLPSLLQWVRLDSKSAGYGGCRCLELMLLLGSMVTREAMEALLWHQLDQLSFREALRSALFLMGVGSSPRGMLWVYTIVYT